MRSKDELLALMADRVCRHAYDAASTALAALPPGSTWQEEIEGQAAELRRSIQQHPGGALLLADSPGTLSIGGLSLMERLLKTLLDAGVPTEYSGIAADTLLSHVTGFALQEQAEPQAPTLTAETYATLRARFPLVMEQMPRLSQNEKFQRSVRLLCTAFETLTKNDGSRA